MTKGHNIRLLLTVPNISPVSSPHREMMLMAEHLPDKNIDVTVCYLRLGARNKETQRKLDDINVPYFNACFRPKGRSFSQIRDALRDQKKINVHGPFDIQHSLDFTSSPFEAMLARWKSRQYIYSQRHINTESQRFVLRTKTSFSHKIHCNSVAAQQQLIRFGVNPDKIHMIYLALDLEKIEPRPREQLATDEPYILYVGHIQERKRQEDAIKAFARVSAIYPALRLLLAGAAYENTYESQLRQLVANLGIVDRVKFLGLRNDVMDLLRGAQALILCSERESLSWSILEAMATGLPVISAAVDGSLEVIRHGENGYLVEVGDVDSYAQHLKTILDNKDLNYEMGIQSRAVIADQFSIPQMIDQMAEMYWDLYEN